MRTLKHLWAQHGALWVLYPLGIATSLHVLLWLGCAFVLWDIQWMTLFAHRLTFACLCAVIWAALIVATVDDADDNTAAAPKSPPPAKPNR